jgi:hypothetical protein
MMMCVSTAPPDATATHVNIRRWAPRVVVVAAVLGLALMAVGLVGFLVKAASLSPADSASIAVAGATMLLAATTGALALFTWESLATAQQEMRNTEVALKVAREQARIAEETLLAGWRPLLTEPLGASTFNPRAEHYVRVNITPRLDQNFTFEVGFVNSGRGPAIVTKAMFGMGSLAIAATQFRPRIVPQNEVLIATFEVDHRPDYQELVRALGDTTGTYDFKVAATYHDIGPLRAWQSLGRLVRLGRSMDFEVFNLEVTEIPLEQAKATK